MKVKHIKLANESQAGRVGVTSKTTTEIEMVAKL